MKWVFYCSYCDDNTTASPCARCGHRTNGYTTEDGSQTPLASDGEGSVGNAEAIPTKPVPPLKRDL